MLANIVLLSWPVVVLILFAAMGREKGLIWSVFLGYLILPEIISFALPGLPDYKKTSAITISILLGAAFFANKPSWPDLPVPKRYPKDRFGMVVKGLFLISLIGVVVTVRDNGYPLIDVDRVRIGLGMRDIITGISIKLIAAAPFFLAWAWLTSPRHHQEILRVLVITGVVYSILAMYEMRMSPQINRTVYGFFPHAWLQHIRGGQFRPVVFLQHGLWLALFLLMASFAAFGLYRSMKESPNRVLYLLAGFWILAVLFVSPNLGAAMLAFIFVPPLLFASRKIQARFVTVTAVIFLIYPAVRQAELVPLDRFLGFVETISTERAASLAFRLGNEDDMLARAYEKPVFGWGGWGRWRVIDEKGRDTTVSDGYWIIILGTWGWVGYLSFFGFLASGILVLSRVVRRRDMDQATITLGLIMAANLVYLIPNSALSPVGWLLCGAIVGAVSRQPLATDGSHEPAPETREGTRYTRFGPGKTPATGMSQTATYRPSARHSRYSRG